MSIQAICSCGATFKAKSKLAGKRVKCPKCKQPFVVPNPQQSQPDAFGLPSPGDDPLGLGESGSNRLDDPLAMPDSSLDDLFDDSLPYQAGPEKHVVTCPSCNTPLSPGTVICISCGYHTQTGERIRKVIETAKEPLPSLPKGITVDESGSKLVIKTTGVTDSGSYVIFFLVLLLVFGGVFASLIFGSRFLSIASSVLIFPAVVGAVGYIVLASFLNRKLIEVESSQISIRTEGPLPWPNIGTRVSVDNITQLYVVEKRRRKTLNHGVGNTSDAILTAIAVHDAHETGYDYYTFNVTVVLKNGWRRRLVELHDRRGAKYIEKKIERFLSIQNVPVVSTWYQRWFLRESTLHDDREDFDPGTAISAKSMPLPTGVMFPGCLLVLFIGFFMFSSMLRFVLPRRASIQFSESRPLVASKELPPKAFTNDIARAEQSKNSGSENHSALEFDGRGSHVSVPSLKYDGTYAITIEAWVIPSDLSKNQSVICNAQHSGLGIGFFNGVCRFFVHGGARYELVDGIKKIDSYKQIHIAGVFDGKRVTLFVDGKKQGTGALVEHRHKPSSLTFLIGANPAPNKPPAEFFAGTVDEVRISSTARYADDFTPQHRFDSDEFTIALYHFDEGVGETAKDSSGNDLHSKIVGATWIESDP